MCASVLWQMQQHKFGKIKKTNASTSAVVHQVWQKSGNCPSGTVPIRRMTVKAQIELEQEQLTACKTEVGTLGTNVFHLGYSYMLMRLCCFTISLLDLKHTELYMEQGRT
jgi:hypothetical protein